MKYLWIKLKGFIAQIGLVDRFLILFMLILLLYTAAGLFTGITDSQNGDMVDTIIRTSSASIFGYFISSNFVKTNMTNSTTDSYRKLQVIIVSFIGGCALILLFIIKFFISEPPEVSATVSQLRDFVSACIGFLVSYRRTK